VNRKSFSRFLFLANEMADEHLSRPTRSNLEIDGEARMPDHTEYETGARHRVEKKEPDDNENFSQDAAANKRPPSGLGNSESKEDVNEKTRHSDGQNRVSSGGED
jgi:hypothetical protein